MPPHLEIIHTGFDDWPWQAAIDGAYLRTTHGQIRRFQTDGACHKALRREVNRRGMEYTIPHERHEKRAVIQA
jgi:hypothetical protein